jgi:hypothetical protein
LAATLSPRRVADGESTLFPVRCWSPRGLLQGQLRTLFDFFSLSLHRGSGTEIAARAASQGGSKRYSPPRGVLQEHLRTLFIFSPGIEERAAGTAAGPPLRFSPVWRRPRRVLQEHLRTLSDFFTALLAGASNSPPAPNASVAIQFGRGRRLERVLFLWRLVQSFPTIGFAGQSISL